MNFKDNRRLGTYRNPATYTEIQNFVCFLCHASKSWIFSYITGGGKHFTIAVPEFQPNYKPPLTFTQHTALRHILQSCCVSINSLPYVSITNNCYCEFFLPVFTRYIFLYDRKILIYSLYKFIAKKNDKSDALFSILILQFKES